MRKKRSILHRAAALLCALALCCNVFPLPAVINTDVYAAGSVTTITLPETLTLNVGEKSTLTATVEPQDADNPTLEWSSTQSGVASVNPATGEVTAVAKGTTVITATATDGSGVVSNACAVTVNNPVTSVTLDQSTYTLYTNVDGSTEIQLNATVTPADADDTTITWSVSEGDAVTVTNGKVTAVNVGVATVTATNEATGKSASCEITVLADVEGIAIQNDTLSLTYGDSQQLTAVLNPDASSGTVTWSVTAGGEFVEVDPVTGNVTAKGVGTATVQAEVSGLSETFSDTCTVTVSPRQVTVSSIAFAPKTYNNDASVDASTATVTFSNTAFGDALTLSGVTYTAASKDAGIQRVAVSGTPSVGNPNYTLSQDAAALSALNSTVEITPRPVNISFDAAGERFLKKTSDGTTDLPPAFDPEGLEWTTDALEGDWTFGIGFIDARDWAYESALPGSHNLTGVDASDFTLKGNNYTVASAVVTNAVIVPATAQTKNLTLTDESTSLTLDDDVTAEFTAPQNGWYRPDNTLALAGADFFFADASGAEVSVTPAEGAEQTLETYILYKSAEGDVVYGPVVLTYSYDASAPVLGDIELTGDLSPVGSDDQVTADEETVISVTAKDEDSGVDTALVAFSADATPQNVPEQDWAESVTLNAGESGYVHYKLTDKAGNVSYGTLSAKVIADVTAPTGSVTQSGLELVVQVRDEADGSGLRSVKVTLYDGKTPVEYAVLEEQTELGGAKNYMNVFDLSGYAGYELSMLVEAYDERGNAIFLDHLGKTYSDVEEFLASRTDDNKVFEGTNAPAAELTFGEGFTWGACAYDAAQVAATGSGALSVSAAFSGMPAGGLTVTVNGVPQQIAPTGYDAAAHTYLYDFSGSLTAGGAQTVEFSLDGGEALALTANVGETLNIVSGQTVSFLLQTQEPTAELSVAGTVLGADKSYFQADGETLTVRVTSEILAAMSGVEDYVNVTVNGEVQTVSDWALAGGTWTGTVALSAEAEYAASVSVVPALGGEAAKLAEGIAVLDNTAPAVSVEYGEETLADGDTYYYALDYTNGGVPTDLTATLTVTEVNFDADAATAAVRMTKDGEAFTGYTLSAWTDNGDGTHTASLTVKALEDYAADGAYQLTVEAFEDLAKNASSEYADTRSNVIDTYEPAAVFSMSAPGNFYENDGDYFNKAFTASFTVTNDPERGASYIANYAAGLDGEQSELTGWTIDEDAETGITVYSFSVDPAAAADGVYTFTLSGVTNSGNRIVITQGENTSENDPAADTDGVYTSGRKVLDTVAPVAALTPEFGGAANTGAQNNRFYLNAALGLTLAVTETNFDAESMTVEFGANTQAEDYAADTVSDWTELAAENQTYTAASGNDGLYALRLSGTDKAGNDVIVDAQSMEAYFVPEAKYQTYFFAVDTAAPTLAFTFGDFYAAAIDGQGNYTVSKNEPYQSITSATASFLGSDCSPYTIDYEFVSTLEEQQTVPSDAAEGDRVLTVNGQQVISLKSLTITDRAGNSVSMAQPTNNFYFDVEAPATDELDPLVQLVSTVSASGRGPAGNPLYDKTVTVEARIADPNRVVASSGLRDVTYRVTINGQDATGLVQAASGAGAVQAGVVTYPREDGKLVYEDTIVFTFDAASFNYNDVKIEVYAADNADNAGGMQSYAFGIDTTAPSIRVTYDNNDVQNDRYFKADRTATIVVTERNFDPSQTAISTQVTPSAWTYRAGDSANGDDDTWTCTVSYTADGDYTFDVSAKDLAGHDAGEPDYGDSAAPTDFVLDKTAPVITVTFDNNDVRNGRYFNAGRTATVRIDEHNFNAPDAQVETTAAVAEGSVATPAASGWTSGGDVNTATVPFAADGDYTMRVNYTDLAGNAAQEVTVAMFTVDTTAPTLEFSGVADRSANRGDVAPVITYHDINYDTNGTSVSITGYKNTDGRNLTGTRSEDAFGGSFVCANIEAIPGNDDVYRCVGTVTDLAGNVTQGEIMFSVNRFGSNYILSDDTQALVDGRYTAAARTLNVTEINVDTLEFSEISYTLNGQTVTLAEGADYEVAASGGSGTWKQYDYTIRAENFSEEGVYDVTIYSEDAAGNINTNVTSSVAEYAKTLSFVVDKTAPSIIITGVEEASYNANERTVVVNYDENYAMAGLTITNGDRTVTYDAEQLEAMSGSVEFVAQASASRQTIVVTAVDRAGNESSAESARFLLTTNPFIRFINNTPLVIGTVVLVAAVAAVAVVLAKRRATGKEKPKAAPRV